MKILLITPTQTGIGGIAQHVSGLANFLKMNGHEVDIISSDNTFTIPIKGLLNPSFMISSFLKTKFKNDYDLVHAHNIPSALGMKNIRGKKILTIHGVYSKQIKQLHGNIASTFSQKYEKNALNNADFITVVSKEAFEYYSSLGYKIHHVPNAIDLQSLSKIQEKQYEKQIIFAGRLSTEKGIDTLCEIAKKIPDDTHLIILGMGPEEHKIKNISRSNVHYLGYQSKEKTIELIRGSDLLLQPSLMEGISSTLLEAMACKTMVIATNIGGNKEIIQNNETGILVKPNSSLEIIQNINAFYANPSKFESLKENAFNYVKKYDWEKIGNNYLKIYETSLN